MATALWVPLRRITAASAPGPSTVLVRTVVSYCRAIQPREQRFGLDSRSSSTAPMSPGSGTCASSSSCMAASHSGLAMGRLYTGASSARG